MGQAGRRASRQLTGGIPAVQSGSGDGYSARAQRTRSSRALCCFTAERPHQPLKTRLLLTAERSCRTPPPALPSWASLCQQHDGRLLLTHTLMAAWSTIVNQRSLGARDAAAAHLVAADASAAALRQQRVLALVAHHQVAAGHGHGTALAPLQIQGERQQTVGSPSRPPLRAAGAQRAPGAPRQASMPRRGCPTG